MQMQRAKVGNRHKARRSSKDKDYYKRYRMMYSGKLIRRRGNRERRLKAANEHPEVGSPSQLKLRKKAGRL
jgi:hypothetical protein